MDILLASARSDLLFALEVLLRAQPGMAVAGTATGTEGLLALMGTTCPDVVIFDWDLPGRRTADVLAAARAAERPPYVIILDKDDATRQVALRAGADDFVQLGTPPQRLLCAVLQAREQRGLTTDPIPAKAKGE